jgi:DNA-binding MarR family transcriptional regulator
MRRLAEGLGCDASNVTGIVDRLEERGLVRRQAAGHDRRVKELTLTAAGIAARAEVIDRLAEPPEAIARLSADDQQALCAILRKALRR